MGTCVTRGAPDGTAARSSRLRCSTQLSSLASSAGARMVTVGSFRSAGRSIGGSSCSTGKMLKSSERLKPREAKGEHRDRFAHKHGVVVVRPACGERDTCGNSGPDYDGGATMDPEPTVGPAAPLPVVLTTPMIAA